MALIKCPECGKEVSDRAEICIHCGYPLKEYFEEEKEKNKEEKIDIDKEDDSQKDVEDLQESEQVETNIEEEEQTTQKVEDNNEEESTHFSKRKRNILTIVILVIAVIIVIVIAALALRNRNSEKELSEQEKMKIVTSMLGQSVNEDGGVDLDDETYAFFNDADLFGYHGVVEAKYEDYLISVMYWESDEGYEESEEIEDLVRNLEEIYGQYDFKNNEYDILTDAYVWTENTENCNLVALGFNEDGVVAICWSDETIDEKDVNDTAASKGSSSTSKKSYSASNSSGTASGSKSGSSSGSTSGNSSGGSSSSASSTHTCAVSGCNKTGTYSIIGLSGEREYYCAEHYAELNAMEDSIENSVGTTHTCAVSGCNKAGTRSIIGISGQREYYCETHYKEMQGMVNDMLGE